VPLTRRFAGSVFGLGLSRNHTGRTFLNQSGVDVVAQMTAKMAVLLKSVRCKGMPSTREWCLSVEEAHLRAKQTVHDLQQLFL
jgi:hypothetical protein